MALDLKRVPHTRRWPPGGLHPVVTFILTRGKHQTVPVLVMDGEGIGDSTEIIRRLEERYLSKHVLKRFLDLRFSTGSPELAEEAERRVVAALDRLDESSTGAATWPATVSAWPT